MKSFLIALSLFSVGAAFAETSPEVQKKIEQEVEKDLKGQPSCFKGAVKAKMAEMEENYGGRFGGNYEVNTQTVFETTFRYTSKYCSEYYDINMNILDENADESLIAFRRCENADTNKSIGSITFGASTSGTLETEGLAFGVDYVRTNDLIVTKDAGYHAEESEIKSWKVTETLACKLIEL